MFSEESSSAPAALGCGRGGSGGCGRGGSGGSGLGGRRSHAGPRPQAQTSQAAARTLLQLTSREPLTLPESTTSQRSHSLSTIAISR